MIEITLKGLWLRKRRLVGTLVAVFLGVAFLAGALALGDTLRANFASLFTNANAGTDAVVRSATSVQSGGLAQRTLIPASVLPQVRAVPGVADAQPSITGYGELIGSNGKAIGGMGPPRVAANWIPDPALNPYRLVSGRAPQADNEVVINRGAADDGDLHLGQTTTVETPQPVTVRIVGIATFGSADGFGTATYTAFSLAGAERYITGRPDVVTNIPVKAAPGVSQDALVSRIQPVLPSGVQVITGSQLTSDNVSSINSTFLDALRTFLLVFAGIALLVASFSISNTFAIVTAQRSREAALMRAIGASRRQILGSVVIEALVVGVVASALGVVGGLAIAGLLKGLFDIVGFALPAGGLVFTAGSVILALVVGVAVTLLAGLPPALRASRVPPLAALRETTTQAATLSRRRVLAGAGIGVGGVVVVLLALTGTGTGVLWPTAIGAVATLVGMVILGPVVARPATALLGWPAARLRGAPGVLARGNAMRNPRRTSAAATALMVGVAVVTLFTVFAASLKSSVSNGVADSFRGDLAITPNGFVGGGPGSNLPPQLATASARLPQVQVATGLGSGRARVAGQGTSISVVDPAQIGSVLDLHAISGSITRLGPEQMAVSQHTADDNHWQMGTRLPVTYPDGSSTTLAVGAIYQSRDLAGDYVLPQAAWAPHAVQTVDSAVFIKLEPGTSVAGAETAVKQVAASYGSPTVQDHSAFVSSAAGPINTVLGIVYVMLVLAIVIALFGIANTLSLSIFERTRELGLLRAIGETREQLRSSLRWESVIIALFGTAGGLGLGLFLGWALAEAVNIAEGVTTFAAPPAQLVAIVVVGGLSGVLAATRPARRAARLPMLAAIATE